MHFDDVYMAPRVRVALNSIFQPQYTRKFWELIDKLRSGRFDIKGLNVEKLHTKKGKVYSARLNVEIRVIFSMFRRGEKRSLVIWDANHHDEAYDRVERTCIPAAFQDVTEVLTPMTSWGQGAEHALSELTQEAQNADSEELTDGLLLFKIPHYVLTEPNKYVSFERNIDRYLRLTQEQEELILRHDKAYLVQGSAGTGKTTLALFHALNLYERNPEDDIFFFTYQEELACVCRCYKVNLVGEDAAEEESESGGLRVFSYLEFCRHYLKKNLESMRFDWQWINRDTSLSYLDEIIRSKSRWQRSIQAEDTYSYIYSILKGRFVPGTDRFPESDEDYQRIFKGYGATPKNLDEVMEIFRLYESRLHKSHKQDEADLIRYCYQSMKDSATLSVDKRSTWIVIDEIQDFTELEWKSILLFWENKCRVSKTTLSFPFLSGDKNQNISRSGFRWQEVDSYIEAILKNMHRPNALVKVRLHNNFRNTLEIFNLGKLILESAPELGGDIGTPPRFSAGKPQLVIGEESDFLDFLQWISDGRENQLPAPLVVLFEDEVDLKKMRRKLVLDDGLFLMPLRKSKGMEFEDCILYRLFSSSGQISEDADVDLVGRLFDLWYMAITRARKNLLIYLRPDDWVNLQKFFSSRLDELKALVELSEQPAGALSKFYDNSEKYVPNYNVIFLERIKAQEVWDDSKDLEQFNDLERETRRQQALRLWKKCRDWPSLGKAYKDLGEYPEAIRYLKLSNLPYEVACCYEQMGEFEEAAAFYEEAHELLSAARCFEKCGRYQRAAELFEINREWLAAASNYAEAGDNKAAAGCYEKAERYEEAAYLYRIRGEWLKAAELFSRSNLNAEAAEMYLKVKDKLDAARCYIAAGQDVKAAQLLESLNRWAEAAECLERAGELVKAGALYGKAGKLKELADCAQRSGDLVRAASAYERMKNWVKAAECHLAANNRARAAQCFESAQDWAQALPLFMESEEWLAVGRCFEHMGDLTQAAEYYLRVDAFNEAAYCCEKGESWNESADYYLKAGNLTAAAPMLAKLGRRIDAARLFLLAGQITLAMEVARAVSKDDPEAGGRHGDLRLDLAVWAEQTGRLDIAASVYEHVGQMMLAGHRYKQAMMFGKAAHCFEKDKKLQLAAELYLQDGQMEKAAHCFKALSRWKDAGQCFEKAKDWAQAILMYEKCGDLEAARRCQVSSQWL